MYRIPAGAFIIVIYADDGDPSRRVGGRFVVEPHHTAGQVARFAFEHLHRNSKESEDFGLVGYSPVAVMKNIVQLGLVDTFNVEARPRTA